MLRFVVDFLCPLLMVRTLLFNQSSHLFLTPVCNVLIVAHIKVTQLKNKFHHITLRFRESCYVHGSIIYPIISVFYHKALRNKGSNIPLIYVPFFHFSLLIIGLLQINQEELRVFSHQLIKTIFNLQDEKYISINIFLSEFLFQFSFTLFYN